jgi:hypothetical protein
MGKILTGKPFQFDGKNPWVSGEDFPSHPLKHVRYLNQTVLEAAKELASFDMKVQAWRPTRNFWDFLDEGLMD